MLKLSSKLCAKAIYKLENTREMLLLIKMRERERGKKVAERENHTSTPVFYLLLYTLIFVLQSPDGPALSF